MKRHRRAKHSTAKRSSARFGRKLKLKLKLSKARKAAGQRQRKKAAAYRAAWKPRPKQAKKPRPPAAPVAAQFRKAADEVPTLEQVTITCANCGRPFKVFKLKGLSLEGTICQRCSLGEMELPESFG